MFSLVPVITSNTFSTLLWNLWRRLCLFFKLNRTVFFFFAILVGANKQQETLYTSNCSDGGESIFLGNYCIISSSFLKGFYFYS